MGKGEEEGEKFKVKGKGGTIDGAKAE